MCTLPNARAGGTKGSYEISNKSYDGNQSERSHGFLVLTGSKATVTITLVVTALDSSPK